jgi:hypothetical protein
MGGGIFPHEIRKNDGFLAPPGLQPAVDVLKTLRSDKDALDVLRLLQAIPTRQIAGAFAKLTNEPIAREFSREALASLRTLFSALAVHP